MKLLIAAALPVSPIALPAMGSPATHWDVTYVPQAVIMAYTDSETSPRPSYFQHVCTEKYVGRW